MSAINPASFVTPVAGLQLPSGLGPGAFNTDSDPYTTHRPQQNDPAYSVPTTSNLTHGTFDRLWDTNQSAGVPSLPFGHIYSQPFQPQDLGTRHLDQLPMEYRLNGQHSAITQSRYHPTPQYLEGLHPYTMRPDSSNGGARKPHLHGNDWSQAFQGLSLGSH